MKRMAQNGSSNFQLRFVMSVVLISSFVFIAWLGPFYCAILVLFITMGVFQEIIRLKRKKEAEKRLPGFFMLRWYLFFVTQYYLSVRFLSEQTSMIVKDNPILDLLFRRHHSFFTYGFILIGIVAFVLSLRKMAIRYQFDQLAWTLVTLLIVVVQGMAQISNIYRGLIWFFLPTSLVISNDVMAYIVGKLLGRTQLTFLSPKKTWEGFLGATLCTIILGVIAADIMQQFPFLICENKITMTPGLAKACLPSNPSFLFKKTVTHFFVPDSLTALPGMNYQEALFSLQLSPVQLHACFLGMFASLIAPFGGFFASGFKRAFKIKDFGESIPGHGGFTDRFDCQILMGMFTYIYIHSFVLDERNPAETVVHLFESLSMDDQREIFPKLKLIVGL